MVMEPPTPQCVGREFVRQYYTLLNQAPLHLHRFYNGQSSFVHGGIDSGTDAEVVRGQQEIHQKILQLNFKDCHAKIRKVDSHETLADGVVVQVSGELSNNGQPMRRFVQTFVLAPQSPKKYYVHNDIFRYQDEVFSDCENEATTSITTDEVRLEEPIQKQIIAAASKPVVLPVPSAPQLHEPVIQEPVTQETFPEAHMNGGGGYKSAEEVEQASMDVEDTEWSGAESNQWKDSQPETWKQEEEEADPMVDEEEQEEEEEEATPPQESSSEPMSWSSRVKMGSGGKPPVVPGTGSKEGTPFTQPAAGQGKPYRGNRGTSQGRPSTGAPGAAPAVRPDRRDDEPREGRNRMMSNSGTNDHLQLFVGNLPQTCTDNDLQDLFQQFGKVAEVRINKKIGRNTNNKDGKVPNFGFVVFEESGAVELAMKIKPTLTISGYRLNIEEKKTKQRDHNGSGGERGGGQGFSDRVQGGRGERGSQDNLRGAGHSVGRGGGGDRGRVGGGGGRGGGRGRSDFGSRGRGGPPSESRGGGFRGGGGGGPRQN